MAAAEPNIMRIVLLGKTGSGKSSLANTLLGAKDVFEVYHTSTSGTMTCQSQTESVNGRSICLIDTPGLFDTGPKSNDPSSEILKCLIECVPGPHTFLLLLKVERFTKHEKDVGDTICKYFSEEALKYTTVVFTHGNDLPEGMKIEEWVSHNEALSKLLWKCGGRYHVFDNTHWKNTQDQYRNNKVQVKELLNTIDSTVRQNRGGFYTNENLKKVQEEIEQEEARIRGSPGNLSEQEIKEKAKKNIFKSLLAKIAASGFSVTVLGAYWAWHSFLSVSERIKQNQNLWLSYVSLCSRKY